MLSKSTSVCRFVCSPARVFVWGAVWVLIMDACRQTMSSSFLFWSVCLWYNSALEPISPLRRWQGPSDRVCVCMCVLHTCMWGEGEGGGLSQKWQATCRNYTWNPTRKRMEVFWEGFVWQADMLPYKVMQKRVVGGAWAPPISCCYEANGLDWHAWGRDTCKGPVWILWSVKKWSAQQREWEERENSSKRSAEEEQEGEEEEWWRRRRGWHGME